MGLVALVTGVSRPFGGRFARLLTRQPEIDHVIGVDVIPPAQSLGDAEFIRADIRNPIIAQVIEQAAVDTVVHLNVIATPQAAGGRVTMKEINVIGTMQLLAACQKADSVRRLVVKSSAAVYGATPRDPALFSEGMSPQSVPRSGFGKDSIEVEGYVRGFSRRRNDIEVSVLRLANLLGPSLPSTMAQYFSLPVLPTALGFDARWQFLHEDDAVAALLAATLHDTAVGIVNVAGDGVVTVRQAARMLGRPTLPVPLVIGPWVGQVVRRAGLADFAPDQIQHLAYGRALDTTRMRTVLGFEPQWTTRQTLAAYLEASRGPQPTFLPAVVAGIDEAQRWAAAHSTARASGDL